MSSIINSPILYMGNKSRLIKRGLTFLFPTNIDTFIDVFAGSGAVSMNTPAKHYILNDTDNTLHKYYNIFATHYHKTIIQHIKQRIKEFDLPQKTTIRCFSNKYEVEKYKKAYHKFRDKYNQNKNILDLYTLMFFAFSQQFRINKYGDFNMPFGNNCFSPQNEKNIINGCKFFTKRNIDIYKKDFIDLLNGIKIKKNDFIYFDSPYSITTATYNESNQWSKDDDLRLFQICEKLHKNNMKFGISNVFINKGVENTLLKDFCKANKFNVFSPNNFKYHACGKANQKQQEVYICNYEIANNTQNWNINNI